MVHPDQLSEQEKEIQGALYGISVAIGLLMAGGIGAIVALLGGDKVAMAVVPGTFGVGIGITGIWALWKAV